MRGAAGSRLREQKLQAMADLVAAIRIRGFTYERAALFIGVGSNTLSRWASGGNPAPALEDIQAAAYAFRHGGLAPSLAKGGVDRFKREPIPKPDNADVQAQLERLDGSQQTLFIETTPAPPTPGLRDFVGKVLAMVSDEALLAELERRTKP